VITLIDQSGKTGTAANLIYDGWASAVATVTGLTANGKGKFVLAACNGSRNIACGAPLPRASAPAGHPEGLPTQKNVGDQSLRTRRIVYWLLRLQHEYDPPYHDDGNLHLQPFRPMNPFWQLSVAFRP
jgi:hypothetical protein